MEKNTIGKAIGKVVHTFSVKNDHEEKAQITVTFDFSTATDEDVKGWLIGNRVIAYQRPLRALTLNELKKLDKTVVIAQNAGQKVKSAAEQAKLAEQALANMDRDAAKALLEKILAEEDKEEDKEETAE